MWIHKHPNMEQAFVSCQHTNPPMDRARRATATRRPRRDVERGEDGDDDDGGDDNVVETSMPLLIAFQAICVTIGIVAELMAASNGTQTGGFLAIGAVLATQLASTAGSYVLSAGARLHRTMLLRGLARRAAIIATVVAANRSTGEEGGEPRAPPLLRTVFELLRDHWDHTDDEERVNTVTSLAATLSMSMAARSRNRQQRPPVTGVFDPTSLSSLSLSTVDNGEVVTPQSPDDATPVHTGHTKTERIVHHQPSVATYPITRLRFRTRASSANVFIVTVGSESRSTDSKA